MFTCILNQSSAVIVSKNTSLIKSRINSLFEQLLYLIKNNGSFFGNLPFENTIFLYFCTLFCAMLRPQPQPYDAVYSAKVSFENALHFSPKLKEGCFVLM